MVQDALDEDPSSTLQAALAAPSLHLGQLLAAMVHPIDANADDVTQVALQPLPGLPLDWVAQSLQLVPLYTDRCAG